MDFKREISGFCLNFRPYEEFYDLSKVDQTARLKKIAMYSDPEQTIPTERKFKATQSTMTPRVTENKENIERSGLSPYFDRLSKANNSGNGGKLPERGEYSPSPMKPQEQENTYKYGYSSMIGKMPLFGNMSQAEINTNNGDTDKDNYTEVEPIRPLKVDNHLTVEQQTLRRTGSS